MRVFSTITTNFRGWSLNFLIFNFKDHIPHRALVMTSVVLWRVRNRLRIIIIIIIIIIITTADVTNTDSNCPTTITKTVSLSLCSCQFYPSLKESIISHLLKKSNLASLNEQLV